MDVLSRIFAWLSDHEAGISAVAAIIVIGGVVLAGLRLLVRRRRDTAQEKVPAGTSKAPSATDASAPDLDPLTVPGFEERSAIAVSVGQPSVWAAALSLVSPPAVSGAASARSLTTRTSNRKQTG